MALIVDPQQLRFRAIDLSVREREDAMLLGDPANFTEPPLLTAEQRAAMHAMGIAMPPARMNVRSDSVALAWNRVREALSSHGMQVEVLDAPLGMPDFCFTAAHALPVVQTDGFRHALLSRFVLAWRDGEVEVSRRWLDLHDYHCVEVQLPRAATFEGLCDTAWHPARTLLYIGMAPRLPPATANEVAKRVADATLPVVGIEIVDARYPYLHRCFRPLDEFTALVVPTALSARSIAMLTALFPKLIAVPEAEALGWLALSVCCPDMRHVMLPHGAVQTARLLREAGFLPQPFDIDEFLKTGHGLCELMLPVRG